MDPPVNNPVNMHLIGPFLALHNVDAIFMNLNFFLVCKTVIGHGSELCHEVSVYLKYEKLLYM